MGRVAGCESVRVRARGVRERGRVLVMVVGLGCAGW